MANTADSELQTKTNVNIGDEGSSESLDFHDSCTEEQKEFFIEQYDDISDVRLEKLHCTSCDRHLGSNTLGSTYIHPILQVLQCEACFAFYNSGEFKKGSDGSELHCRWCGQGGQVFCCSNCPSVFCQKCIKRNFSRKMLIHIDKSDDWACFRCDPRPLWKLQSKCWALNNYVKREISASLKPGYTEERRQIASTDFSVCCSTRTSSKIKTESSEPEVESGLKNNSRKRRRNRLKSDKSTSSNDSENKQAKRICSGQPEAPVVPTVEKVPEESIKIQPEKPMFEMPNQEQDEVVCTPDIPCFEENSIEPTPPMTEIHEQVPVIQNGVGKTSKTKPRISVRAPETMMSSPDQPMFPTIVQNRPLLQPIPGSSLMANATPMALHTLPMLRPGSNLIQLNDGRLLTLSNPNATYPVSQNVVTIPVSHITTTMPPPPLIPQMTQSQGHRKQTPVRSPGFKPNNNRQVRYTMAVNPSTFTPAASTSNRAMTLSTVPKMKPNPLADQTLSSLLQKKLRANPNISRVKLRKMPDWFQLNVQSCLMIARTFITQLMDLTNKAQKMQDCSYDDIKNMHVQLSFLISAVIGKYKNNQLDLNLQLSEWTDVLCKSMETAAAEPAPPPASTSVLVPTPAFVPISKIVATAPKHLTHHKRPGQFIRKQYKEIFAKYASDRKLCMDAVVIVQKFRYHKSTNVFKVKPKYKPILRTPNIDPNVIQTIDSESDDDDCAIIPGPDPLLIDLDSASENGDPVAKGNLDDSGSISVTENVTVVENEQNKSASNKNEVGSEIPTSKAITSEVNTENEVVTKENPEISEKVAQDKSKENESGTEDVCQIKIVAVTSGAISVAKDLNTTDKETTPNDNGPVDSNDIENIANEIDSVLNATEQVLNQTEQVSNDIEMISKDNETVSDITTDKIQIDEEIKEVSNEAQTNENAEVGYKVDSVEIKKDTVMKETVPGANEDVLDMEEAVPVPNQAIPVTKETVPAPNKTVPGTKETVPATNEAISGMKETVPSPAAPVTNEAVPVPNQVVPVTKETVPVPNESVTVTNESVTLTNEAVTVTNEAEPGTKVTVPVPNQETVPVPYETVPNEVDTVPNEDSTKEEIPVPNESVPVPNEPVPATNEPVNEPTCKKLMVVIEKIPSDNKDTNQIADNDKSSADLNGDFSKIINTNMEEMVSSVTAEEVNNLVEEIENLANERLLNVKEDQPMDITDVNELASDIAMDIPDCDNEAVTTDTSEPKNIKTMTHDNVNSINVTDDVKSTD